MKRLLIPLLVLLIAVIAIPVGGYLYLSSRDNQVFREQIEAALQSALGRTVTIGSVPKVELNLLPTVTLVDIAIANSEWGTRPDMATVGQVEIQLRALPLLQDRLVITRLEFRDIDLWLENDRSGRGNWSQSRADGGSGGREIRVNTLLGSDLSISYFNSLNGTIKRIDLEHVRFRAASGAAPVVFELDGVVADLPLELSGSMGNVSQLLSDQGFELLVEGQLGETGLRASGRVADQDFRDYQGVEIDLEVRGRRPALLLEWTDLPIPEIGRYELQAKLLGEGEKLAMEGLQARVDGQGFQVAVAGRAEDIARVDGLDLRVDVSGQSLATITEVADSDWLRTDRFSATGNLRGNRHELAADQLDIELRHGNLQSTITGSIGNILQGDDAKLAYRIRGENIGAAGHQLPIDLPDLDFVDLEFSESGRLANPAVENLSGLLREGDLEATVSGRIGDVIHLRDIAIGFHLTGEKLAHLSDLFDLELPETDQVSMRGRVTGDRHDLDLMINEAELSLDELRLLASGTISDILEVPRLDLESDLQGLDVNDLELAEAGLRFPSTDSFRVRARVIGHPAAPNVRNVRASARIGTATIEAQGSIDDVFDRGVLGLETTVEGADLARLGAMIGEEWLTTDAFRMSGMVGGTWQAIGVEQLRGQATTARSDLRVEGRIGDVLNTRDIDISVHGVADSVRAILPWDHPVWDRLGSLDARMQVSGGPNIFGIGVTDLVIGDSRLQGDFDFDLRTPGLRRVSGSFRPGQLDVTPWLARDSSSDNAEVPGDKATSPIFPDKPLPLEWMEGLALDVAMHELELMAGTGRLEVTDGRLLLEAGTLRVDPFALRYLGSAVSGGLTLESGEVSRLAVRAESLGFDLGSLLRRAGIERAAEGQVDLALSFDSRGRTPRELAQSANGNVAVLISDAVIPNTVVPLHFTDTLVRTIPWVERREDIKVICAMLDLPIDAGIGRTNVLVVDTDDALTRGEGTINLHTETMRVRLVPQAKRVRAMAHNVDVEIKGPMRAPRLQVNTLRAAGSAARAAGRFTLLGPLGLFVSTETFADHRQECAQTLSDVSHLRE